MMTNLTKLATIGTLAALLSGTPALAQEIWEEEGWDVDADGALSLAEFQDGFMARLNLTDWDADGDAMLSEEEFAGGIYDRYDADSTDAIEEEEFTALEDDFDNDGIWRFRGEELIEAPGDEIADADVVDEEVTDVEIVDSEGLVEEEAALLEPWDIDGDGIIVRDEFQSGFTEWGTFGAFDEDADGLITQAELSEGIFDLYDDDLDGLIEEPELTDIGDDMGDEGFFDL